MTHTAQIDVPLNQITYQQMDALLNHTFQLNQEDKQHDITLVEVSKSGTNETTLPAWQTPEITKDSPNNDNKRIPFSVVFCFPKEQPIQQGIYQITHPEAGTFEGAFFTPIAKNKQGVYFEAIFA